MSCSSSSVCKGSANVIGSYASWSEREEMSEGEEISYSSSEEAGTRWWKDGTRGGEVGEEGRGRRGGEDWSR